MLLPGWMTATMWIKVDKGTRRRESKKHKSICIIANGGFWSLDCLCMVPSSILSEHILVWCSNVGSPPLLPIRVGHSPSSLPGHSILSQQWSQPPISVLLLQGSWFTLFSRRMELSTHTEPPVASWHSPHSPLHLECTFHSIPVRTFFHDIFLDDAFPVNPEVVAPPHSSWGSLLVVHSIFYSSYFLAPNFYCWPVNASSPEITILVTTGHGREQAIKMQVLVGLRKSFWLRFWKEG